MLVYHSNANDLHLNVRPGVRMGVKMNKLISVLLLLCMIISLTACGLQESENEPDTSKLTVSVTFDALAEFALAVGQDKIQVSTLVPTGMEPHDFEPKAADISRLSDSKVFVYNGLGMETWVDDTIDAIGADALVVINASDGSSPITNIDDAEVSEHGSFDPHLWLSIKGAELEVSNIAKGFSKADPSNKEFYEKNAAGYIAELEAIYVEYKEKFDSLDNKNFVTGHAAFHYFCQDFSLEQSSVEDVFAEGEPGTRQLADLVDYCSQNHVTTIFAEEMASPEVSQTLANEVGADVQAIHTMESAEGGLTYLERMRDNCDKIYTSLSK